MADPDDEAIDTFFRNSGKTKCSSCNGSGKVMKYVRTKIVDLVDCLTCKGSGLAMRSERNGARLRLDCGR